MTKKKIILFAIPVVCILIIIVLLIPSEKAAVPLLESPSSPVPVSQAISGENFNELAEQTIWGNGSVNRAVFSPDGALFAVASGRGLLIFDTASQELKHTFGQNEWMTAVDFSGDGSRVAGGSSDGYVSVWNLTNESMEIQFDVNYAVQDLAFSPDGELLSAVTPEGGIDLWNLTTQKQLIDSLWESWAYLRDDTVTSLAFSPDGTMVAYGSSEADKFFIRVWDIRAGDINSEVQSHSEVLDVQFSPDSKTLAVTSDKDIVLYSMPNGHLEINGDKWDANSEYITKFAFPDDAEEYRYISATALAYTPNGKELACGYSNGELRFWNTASGKVSHTVKEPMLAVSAIQYTADGNSLITTSNDNVVRLWKAGNHKVIAKYGGFSGPATTVRFSPDGSLLASAGSDGSIDIRSAADGVLLHRLIGHTRSVQGLTFSREGDFLFSVSTDKTVRKWRVSDGKLMDIMDDYEVGLNAIATLPEGFLLQEVPLVATGSLDGGIELWGVPNGKLIYQYQSEDKFIYVDTLAFSPDGYKLASGMSEGILQIWQPITGDLLYNLKVLNSTITALDFASDSNTIFIGSAKSDLKMLNLDNFMQPVDLGYLRGPIVGLFCLEKDAYLLSASNYGEIRITDLVDRRNVLIFDSPFTRINAADLSPDESLLALALPDGTIHIWSVPVQ